MSMDDVIEIKIAAPDSQYRLCNCRKCKSDNVAYALGVDEMWRVRCFDCGFEGPGAAVRHDAQLLWNKAVKGENHE